MADEFDSTGATTPEGDRGGSAGGMPPVDAGAAAGEAPDKDARMWGMLAHLAALAGLTGIPGATVLGPLIVWLVKKDEMPFVDDQGKESLNFQITMLILMLICVPLACVGIGFVLLPIVGVVDLVFTIIAGIKANEGVRYRYPWALRLIK